MPQIVNSISTFRNSLAAICKKNSDGYASCPSDICDELRDLSFEDVWAHNYLIRELGDVRVIKLRIQNSIQTLCKASGFRLIILCNKKNKSITLLNIYPKRGKHARVDQDKSEYKEQLRTYKEEASSLNQHDLSKQLESVENK